VTVLGIDDTDSRERGMCTTYAAHSVAERVAAAGGDVERVLLVRLNPAVEHKTRGNAALAVHTDLDVDTCYRIAHSVVSGAAETEDPRTNPGLVVAPGDAGEVSEPVQAFARAAVRDHHDLEDAERLIAAEGYESAGWKNARGQIGALAAVGAWAAFDEWTYELLSYRERERWGTTREVEADSVFAAAEEVYPAVWDTVDRAEETAVCVPRTPCPVLHGIRGEEPASVRAVASAIESEPVSRRRLFVTNQGTDAHVQEGELGDLEAGRAYRVDATVTSPPETREGGHVFLGLGDGDERIQAAAFEPTKRFRDRVRRLRPGDRITACGEVSDGTVKLEKFAVRDLIETEQTTPTCPSCGRSMASAGRNAGYRCRDCDTHAGGPVEKRLDRALEPGWYEVPPCARRHVAKPLIRGGFDAPTHPER